MNCQNGYRFLSHRNKCWNKCPLTSRQKQCIDVPYFVVPFQRCQGVSLTSAAALTMRGTRSSSSQYQFHKPLTSWSPAKRNLGRSGQESVPARQWAHTTTNQAIVITTNPSWTQRNVYPFPSIPSCKVPLALKRSVAAHRFLNKICFNEGYLSGPKVCRSNLDAVGPCRHWNCIACRLMLALSQSDADVMFPETVVASAETELCYVCSSLFQARI